MPAAVAAPDTTELANRLRPVLLKLARELRREIHSLGVTGGQVSLLVQIKYHPGVGIRELAALERVSVPGMSKFVSRLEEAGLVERASCASDRRVTYAVLTAAGRTKLHEASESHMADIRAYFEGRFSSEELKQLAALLGRLPGAADAAGEDCAA